MMFCVQLYIHSPLLLDKVNKKRPWSFLNSLSSSFFVLLHILMLSGSPLDGWNWTSLQTLIGQKLTCFQHPTHPIYKQLRLYTLNCTQNIIWSEVNLLIISIWNFFRRLEFFLKIPYTGQKRIFASQKTQKSVHVRVRVR